MLVDLSGMQAKARGKYGECILSESERNASGWRLRCWSPRFTDNNEQYTARSIIAFWSDI
jgi:hypothetical protein